MRYRQSPSKTNAPHVDGGHGDCAMHADGSNHGDITNHWDRISHNDSGHTDIGHIDITKHQDAA